MESTRWVTIWLFRSPRGDEVQVCKPAYPDDRQYEHYYQRILYRGPEGTPEHRKVAQ
jgi:hypothetical protein